MSNRPKSVTWKAEPHTIAKIEIVSKYLYRWACITGLTFEGQKLTYIDGFAGPGEYTNSLEGSPIAALNALNKARNQLRSGWKAGDIRALFLEEDISRKTNLELLIKRTVAAGEVKYAVRQCTFEAGINDFAEKSLRNAFYSSAPLVVFIDPFGATGFPFDIVKRILGSRTSEIILNFDADGLARIALAGKDANATSILTAVFGDDSWKVAISSSTSTGQLARALLDLYKARLKSLHNVKYTFAFEMASKSKGIDYYLLFASQHPKGLATMKEAMREIDSSGAYQFCDARIGQQNLMSFETPADWVGRFVVHFAGQTITYRDAEDYTLNETPYITPKKLLYEAEKLGEIELNIDPPRKRKDWINPVHVKSIRVKGV